MSYNSRQRNARRKRFPRLAILTAFLLVAVAAGAPAVSYAWHSVRDRVPSLSREEEYSVPNDTFIYDAGPTPRLLAILNAGENRILIGPDEIPEKMKQALVVIEDDRFYSHRGFDPIGIIRAVVSNFTEGKLVEGGSTITQQYVKNTYVSNEPTLSRKLRETIYAFELEQRWSKDKILSEYLNTIYFGSGAYGLQVAAATYFGKPATDLTLSECALLAALPKSPLRYSPFTNPDAALGRRNIVLAKMLKRGMITPDEFLEAANTPLPTEPHPVEVAGSPAPYFVEYIKEQLVAKYGTRTAFEGGLRVYTTLDPEKQAAAEKAAATVLNQPGDPSVALVSLDPGTSYVRAMVGGRNFEEQNFNVATQGYRQPGSAFKPFVLATAMSEGISPGTTFVSEPKHFNMGGGNPIWEVHNYDELYLGRISLEKATMYSDNAVYSELMMKVGAGKVADMAHRAGVKTDFSVQPAIALGGLDTGVTPLELASAYGTFANNGKSVTGSMDFDGGGADPVSIIRVTDAQGNVVDVNQPRETQAVDPVIAYHVNRVLKQAAMNGTGRWSRLGSRPVAGKSGTTENHVDAWYSGYTPGLVTTVWIGYPDQRTPMEDIRGVRVTGGAWPAQIWNLYMTEALVNAESSDFFKPPNSDLATVQICLESGQVATPWCPTKESRSFFPGQLPQDVCTMHKAPDTVMPSLIGMRLADAWKVVKGMGLEPALAFKMDRTKPADMVVDQLPKPGQKVEPGTTKVTIMVAGRSGSVSPPTT